MEVDENDAAVPQNENVPSTGERDSVDRHSPGDVWVALDLRGLDLTGDHEFASEVLSALVADLALQRYHGAASSPHPHADSLGQTQTQAQAQAQAQTLTQGASGGGKAKGVPYRCDVRWVAHVAKALNCI
jgi:hypothetical protein